MTVRWGLQKSWRQITFVAKNCCLFGIKSGTITDGNFCTALGVNSMIHSLVSLSFWGNVIATLILTHVTVIGVTVYLHRCQAHRSLDVHPILAHFFRLWLWMSTSMGTRAWVAVHRKHHTFVDTEDDPHSPVILGLSRVFFAGVMLYRKERKNEETLEQPAGVAVRLGEPIARAIDIPAIDRDAPGVGDV
jgi:fatty-acid desaturase